MIENLVNANLKNMKIVSGFEVKAKAKTYEQAGHSVVHLELGEPDFDTPANIVEAGVKAMRSGYTHYSPATGLPAFRQAISDYVNSYKGLKSTSDNIVVTPGAKPILYYTILSLVKPGDEVILPSPGFIVYEPLVRYCGGTPVALPLREEFDFRFNPEDLKKLVNNKTKLIIFNSPNNPTGGLLTKEDVEAVAEIIDGKDLMVLSDEIYDRMIYVDEKPVSLASIDGMAEKTIVLDGFSKTYAMTGWRLGYGVMPKRMVELLTPLVVASNSCTATFSQMAGIEALTGDQSAPEKMVAAYKERRDFFVKGLNDIPRISCVLPKGAFYAFPNIKDWGMSSAAAADYLLEEAKIASIPGSSFGEYGEGYLRFAYATSKDNLAEALNRLEAAVAKLSTK
jgi:aspartate/methionine/tyrosine aminotransferase